MVQEYTKKQRWKLYQKLPQDLQEAIFSPETAEGIQDVCKKNEIESVSVVSKIAGDILLGILSPKEAKEKISSELSVLDDKAEKIYQGIYRFVLYPYKKSLAKLYKSEFAPEEPETPKKDIYREPIQEK